MWVFTWAVVITVLMFYKIRAAFLVFVFLLPFSPRYLAIPVGPEGLALTGQRVWIGILSVGVTFFLLRRERFRQAKEFFIKNRAFVLCLMALLLIKLVSTLLYAPPSAFVYFLDEFYFSFFCLIVSAVYFSSPRDIESLFRVIFYSYLLTVCVVLLEAFKGAPILQGLVNINVAGTDVSIAGKSRQGLYRVQGLFDGVLQLTEFILLAFPIALYLCSTSKGFLKLISNIGIIAVPSTIYLTGSRSGLLVGLIGVLIFVLARFWPTLSKPVRGFLLIGLAFVVAYMIFYSYGTVVKYGALRGYDMWLFDEKERSLIERTAQYIIIPKLVIGGDYLGVGLRQNYGNELDSIYNLDSYYMRLLLEGGFLVLILFLLSGFFALQRIAQLVSGVSSGEERRLFALGVVFLATFFCMKFFLSQPKNNVYFYLIFGSLLGYMTKLNKFNIKSLRLG